MKGKNSLFRLEDFGVSVWCDELSRDLIRGGGLAALIKEKAVVGVTSNPTIFEKAISEGVAYDADIEALARAGKPREAIYESLVVSDIREACDLLRPIYDRTAGADGYVSVEVSPELADDTQGTIKEAIRYHEDVGRPNLLVKIPATPAGVPAIQHMVGLGKSINITLIFSVDRYEQVAEAYLQGLEKLAREGRPLRPVASVASFFVSRVDTEADKRIEAALAATSDAARKQQLTALRGRIAVANAKLAFARFKKIFSGARWEALAKKGARVQRCLWASTSTKNKAYSDILYVEELIGGPTVNTMPPATMDAYLDHGSPHGTLSEGLEEAREQIASLAGFGIDYRDLTDNFLERDGVKKFADSYRSLLARLESRRASSAAVGSAR
jgi:transaldolase/glucose-6-phosphate isomerase